MMSHQMRPRLVTMVLEKNVRVATVYKQLDVSLRSASRFIVYIRDAGGALHRKPLRWNRHSDKAMDRPELRYAVLATVERQLELCLDETAAYVSVIQRLDRDCTTVSASTLRRVLAFNGYTLKVDENSVFTRNDALRVAWVESEWRIPTRCRVYVDEVHRTGRSAERRWASAQGVMRAESYVDSGYVVRTSFFAAVAYGKMFDCMVTRPPPGQTSVEVLLFAITHLIAHMLATIPARAWAEQDDRCVLILDNARVHDAVALATLQEAVVFALSLSPYSPDFNPIEDVFSV